MPRKEEYAMKPPKPVPPPTDPNRLRMLRQVESDAPSKVRLFRKLYAPGGHVTPRYAIKCQCLQCCWMDRIAIRECTDTACPLWSFRPYRDGKPAGDVGTGDPAIPLSGVERRSEQTLLETRNRRNATGDSHPPLAAEIDTRNCFQEAKTP